MAFSTTTSLITSALQNINKLGVYSFQMYESYSPLLGSILFGEEMLGMSANKSVRMKDIMADSTTSKDGRSVEWRTIAHRHIKTTTTSAGTSSTTLAVASTIGFSKGDAIKIINSAGDVYTNIVSVDSPTQLTIKDSSTWDNGAVVVRVSYSKIKGKSVDRADYTLNQLTTSNYFQDFGARFSIDNDTLNSHIESAVLTAGVLNPKDSLDSKFVMNEIANYLQQKLSQKVGIEILGDIARAFYDGKKLAWTSGGDTRYYTGGLAEVITTTDNISSTASDDAKLAALYDVFYDVKHKGNAFGNKKTAFVANNAFIKEFSKLRPSSYQLTLNHNISQFGYEFKEIVMPDGTTMTVAYEPMLDMLEINNKPTAYVLPIDLIGFKTRKYTDVNNELNPVMGGADIIVQRTNSSADTLDTTELQFYHVGAFVFGGSEEQGLYRKIVIS